MVSRNFNPTTLQESPDDGDNTVYRGCVSKTIHVTGVMHIMAGSLCVVFGIAAIVLEAFMSYLGLPIWGGLFIFITTGIIGVSNYYRPERTKTVKAYLVMSTISSVFALLMIVAFGIFLAHEYDHWQRFICQPLIRSFCESPSWSRILTNAILTFVFVLETLCGGIAASVTCYKACQCCRGGCAMLKRCRPFKICRLCMDDPGNSNVVYYAVNMNEMPMMAVPNNQGAGPIYIAGESSGTSILPSQPLFVAPSPESRSFVAMPAVAPQQNQPIPRLPPPPQQQPSHQQQPVLIPQSVGMVQQPSGSPSGQAGFVQVQASGQMQAQVLAQNQSAPEHQSTLEQSPTSLPQPTGNTQQFSGFPAGQTGFIQVQAPGQIQPQVIAQAQPVPQAQPTGLAQQLSGYPPGQVGFFQVQGPGGQIQMVPAVYPQFMMAPGPQQPRTTEEQVPQTGPAEESVQQPTVPSECAETHGEEEGATEDVSHSGDPPSGEISSGQFNDKSALI